MGKIFLCLLLVSQAFLFVEPWPTQDVSNLEKRPFLHRREIPYKAHAAENYLKFIWNNNGIGKDIDLRVGRMLAYLNRNKGKGIPKANYYFRT